MGCIDCSDRYKFPFPSALTLNELLKMMEQENYIIKEEVKMQLKHKINNEPKIYNLYCNEKIKFLSEFNECSEILIEFLRGKRIKDLKKFSIMINDCYDLAVDMTNNDFKNKVKYEEFLNSARAILYHLKKNLMTKRLY